MKHHRYSQKALAAAMACLLSGTALAGLPAIEKGLMFNPDEVPPAAQVQLPPTDAARAPLTTLSVKLEGQPDGGAIAPVAELTRAVLNDELPAVAAVHAGGETAPAREGFAENLATDPVKAQIQVALKPAPAPAPKGEPAGMAGAPGNAAAAAAEPTNYLVSIRQVDGSVKDAGSVPFDPAQPQAYQAAVRDLVIQTLDLKPAVSEGPQLKLWSETQDGGPIRVGSQVAFYLSASQDGYVSVYDFGTNQAVNRVFPSKADPNNFVEKDRIYRIPGKGWLTVYGEPGQATLKGVYTQMPSNADTSRVTYKGGVMQVIPTHHPTLFADHEMRRFFQLPRARYAESYLGYEVTKP